MFNRKKLKEIKAQNELIASKLTEIQMFANGYLNNLNSIDNKINPKPIRTIKYTLDAAQFKDMLKSKYPLKKKCGGGYCELYYQIPRKELE